MEAQFLNFVGDTAVMKVDIAQSPTRETLPHHNFVPSIKPLSPTKSTTYEGRRELDALHAIGFLSSLRNLNLTNDIKHMFTLLCILYGAGDQFISMLQHIGVTFSWSTMMNFLDKRIKEMRKMREVKIKEASSIFLLMGNINMYRGEWKHIRLFKYIGPTNVELYRSSNAYSKYY